MKKQSEDIVLTLAGTSRRCPIGEVVGERGVEESRVPVLSCEGACIRGEIARQAANMIAKEAGYGRGCHGELLTAPRSAIAQWIRSADRVVLIDGCFMRCHGRILERLVDADRLVQFDALAVHRRFGDVFDADDVPEAGRRAAARQVAEYALSRLSEWQGPCGDARGQQDSCCD